MLKPRLTLMTAQLTIQRFLIISGTSETYRLSSMFDYVDDVTHVQLTTCPPCWYSHSLRTHPLNGGLSGSHTEIDKAEIRIIWHHVTSTGARQTYNHTTQRE